MLARTCASVLVGLWLVAPAMLSAQQSGAPDATGVLSMLVTSRDDGAALPYGTIAVEQLGVTRFTDVDGRLTFRNLAPGPYTLHIREIGYGPRDTSVTVAANVPTEITVTLSRVAIKLARITVRGHRSHDCRVTGIPAGQGDDDYDAVFREFRANIDRVRLLTEQYPLQYSLERVRVRRHPGSPDVVVEHDTVEFDDRSAGYKPGNVIYAEIDHGEKKQMVRLITFAELADSAFQASHCFDYGGEKKVDGKLMMQIDVRAARWLRDADIEGSISLDAERYVVRRAVFQLWHGDRASPPVSNFAITTTFREVAPLLTVFETVDAEESLGAFERELEHQQLLSFNYVSRLPGQ
jgi:carboxypeptidase family protein